jgi:two-component system sensor histidine kinase ChvG
MRSARLTLFAASLLLLLLPLALLGVAWGYERWLVRRDLQALEGVAREVAAAPPRAERLGALARQARAQVRLLDAEGRLQAESATWEEALQVSPVGGALEALLGLLGVPPAREGLQAADAAAGPLSARPEVLRALAGEPAQARRLSASGQTVLLAQAAPLPGGGVVHVLQGSQRGIRQLLLVRGQLLKLLLLQGLFALLVPLLLTRWLVRPLERLAAGARAYPEGPLAGPALLARPDEVGQLARAITTLAQSLEARRRETVDLAADLAHELKNPLATIAAASELIASTEDPSPEKRRLVHAHVAGAVERLRATTDALLHLVRLEAALPEQRREEVDYGAFLEAVLAEYRRDPRWEGWTLRAEVTPGVGRVSLAREGWASLLRNLLDNALVQPSTRREVVVRARRTAGGVVTEVVDSGPGVSPGNREAIFRRFFTLRPEGVPAGTGLGLSIVRAVAEAHGGRVEVDSPPGGGATFRVHHLG